jgi:hypothetical protein
MHKMCVFLAMRKIERLKELMQPPDGDDDGLPE